MSEPNELAADSKSQAGDGPAPQGGGAGSVISASGLTRHYGKRAAVYEASFEVPRGSVTALLGRNGSGKTTLIRMLLGLIEPTRGRSTVLGHDSQTLPAAVRGRIGYMSESHAMYRWMRVRECGKFESAFHPNWNDSVFRSVVDHFRLDAKTKAGDLSRGERAGLNLALTLAAEPELLILDDPAIGLDPVARRSLLEAMVYVTRREDRTILFSSHLLNDVERVADHAIVIDRSIVRASAPLDAFRQRIKQFVLRFTGTVPAEMPTIPGLVGARRGLGELRVTVASPDAKTAEILRSTGADAVDEVPLSLEDALIGYLGDRGTKGFLVDPAGSSASPLNNVRGAA